MLLERPQNEYSYFTPLTPFFLVLPTAQTPTISSHDLSRRDTHRFSRLVESSVSSQNTRHKPPKNKEDSQVMLTKDVVDFDQLPNAAHVDVDVNVVAVLFGCKPPTIWARLR